jgi:RNA polymerase sigma factor (sigma-70 family)
MPTKGTTEPARLTDEQLFRYLYERYHEKVFESALFYCDAKELAEDVVQEAFLYAWQEMKTLRSKITSLYNWRSFLFIVTRNKAQDSMRLKTREEKARAVYSNEIIVVAYDDLIVEKECDLIFMRAVSQLSYQQKEIFVLKYYRFKTKEIAQELGLAVSTINNTLNNARKLLHSEVVGSFK